MVLSVMRRHATSWIIKILIGLIAIVFIFYFGFSFRAGETPKVAEVNGEPISQKEFAQLYNQMLDYYRKQYGGSWNEELARLLDVKGKVLDIMIRRVLLKQKAEEYGIHVSKEEVRSAIAKYPLFQTNNSFDMRKYKTFLDQVRMDIGEFEDEVKNQILEQKLNYFIYSFLPITKNETILTFNYLNQTVNFIYVLFDSSKYIDKNEPPNDELEAYYKEHKNDFKIPEKIKLAYVTFDPVNYIKNVNVTDSMIIDYYEEHKQNFVEPEMVKARHILISVKDTVKEEDAKKKAEQLYSMLKEGKDFGKLAKEYSDDPGSKDKGGDLGYFKRGVMVKEFEDMAFSLGKGEVSAPVRTQFGYHIIKVEDRKEAKEKTLEEARGEIIKILSEQISSENAYEAGLSFLESWPHDTPLEKYARDKGLSVGLTGFISKQDRFVVPGVDQKVVESLFSMQKGDYTDLIRAEKKYYIFSVVERQESRVPELSEVKDRVAKAVQEKKAMERARSEAEAFLKELTAGKDFQELARVKGLEIKESGSIRRNQPIEGLGYEPEVINLAFKLTTKEPYPQKPANTQKGPVVFKLLEKKLPEEELTSEERAKIDPVLMKRNHEWFMAFWLEELKKKAKIEIHKEMM